MKILIALAFAACGFPEPPLHSTDAADPGPARLTAVTPSLASTGDTITLDGTFTDSTIVHFPGGADVPATILNPHRATALVPATATAGDLTVSVGSTTVGPQRFRRATFSIGIQPVQELDAQTALARQMPQLVTARRYGATVTAKGFVFVFGGAATDVLDTIERARINADGSLGALEVLETRLLVPRASSQAVVIGGFVYLVGGATTGGVALSSIERARIGDDGTLDDFQSIGNLNTARMAHAIGLIGDSLYVFGGSDGAANLTSIERAKIGPDGQLESVSDVGTTMVGRNQHVAIATSGFVYLLSGVDSAGTPLTSVERAPIETDGSLGAFSGVTPLGAARHSIHAVVAGHTAFLVGGGDNVGNSSSVAQATIDPDGSLGAFTTVPNIQLPAPRFGYAAAISGNFVYLIGGSSGGPDLASVVRASLNASGTLASFANTTANLVNARDRHRTVVIGQSLYLIGGIDSPTNPDAIASVERIPIQPDGTLGAVESTDISLSTARDEAGCAVIGNFVYIIGGSQRGGGPFFSSVERAAINSDGTLGAFTEVTSKLVSARNSMTTLVAGNSLYVFGGFAGGAPLTSIERATINPDGSIGAFATFGVTLPSGRNAHSQAVIGSRVYLAGGFFSGALNTVVSAPLDPSGTLGAFRTEAALATARHGSFSTVIGNTIFVMGGNSNSVDEGTIEAATLVNGAITGWVTQAPKLSTARRYASANLLDDRLILAGGTADTTTLGLVEQGALQ